MNLTQLEWIKSELKRSFYEQNKISGKSINKWIEINQNLDFKSGVDFGFKINKLDELLCKISSRRGIMNTGSLDLDQTVQNRSGGENLPVLLCAAVAPWPVKKNSSAILKKSLRAME